jgi:hypothetical protein
LGNQTTVVIQNDYAHDIKESVFLLDRLYHMLSSGEIGEVMQGFKIIESHHCDHHLLVRVGGGTGRVFARIGGKHPFDLAKEAAEIIDPIDPKLANQVRKGTTPESLLPLSRSCITKVGRKSRFDQNKVNKEQMNKLVDFNIACLESTLELAYYMKEE